MSSTCEKTFFQLPSKRRSILGPWEKVKCEIATSSTPTHLRPQKKKLITSERMSTLKTLLGWVGISKKCNKAKKLKAKNIRNLLPEILSSTIQLLYQVFTSHSFLFLSSILICTKWSPESSAWPPNSLQHGLRVLQSGNRDTYCNKMIFHLHIVPSYHGVIILGADTSRDYQRAAATPHLLLSSGRSWSLTVQRGCLSSCSELSVCLEFKSEKKKWCLA